MRLFASRRTFLNIATTSLAWLAGCVRQPARQLRIGFQKGGTFAILKASGSLERNPKLRNVQLSWIEFAAGPPLLEALNAGSLDVGHAGDSPPLFAQAAGVPFLYFAASSASPKTSGILVRHDSPIHQAADLKDKRIGFGRGTSAHTMVLRYLEKQGIPVSEIRPSYLPPAAGREAMENGSIDAWAIWDPFLAAAEEGGRYRKLTTGEGYVEGREFYFTSRAFVERSPDLLNEFLAELNRMKDWAKSRPDEVIRLLVKETGIPENAIRLAESRRNRYDTEPITDALIENQQAIAERYFELQVLPKRINVASAVLPTKP